MPVRNDTKPTTTTTTKAQAPKTPTPAETKAAEAAAKAKAEEGAEDIGGPQTPAKKPSMSSTEVERTKGDISKALITGETDVVMDKLMKLPPADAKAEFEKIAADPDKLATMMEGDNKLAFLQLMTSRGYVGVEPAVAQPTSTSPRAPQPPAAQSMYRDDAKLPAPLREALLNENITAAKQYKEDFADYRDAYRSAVTDSKTMGELRGLGPMAQPATPEHLPGAKMQDPNNLKYEAARGHNRDDVDTMGLVADQARRLSGRPIAGDISFGIDAKVMVTLDGYGYGADASAKTSVKGPNKVSVTPTMQVKEGAVTVKANAEGTLTTTIEQDTAKVKITTGDHIIGGEVSNTVGGDKIGISAQLDDKKGFKGGVTVDGIGVKGQYNGDSMGFGVSREFELKGGGAGVKGEVGFNVGMQGVTEADADSFVSDRQTGFFYTPPELARGKSWSSLSDDDRRDYENLGWSEKEWSTRVDLERAKRR